MSYEITGILVEKYPAVDVSGKFRKREFVISKSETVNGFDYTDYIKIQLTQDKCNLIENLNQKDRIKVFFNLRGRKWEKDGTTTYFTNLEAWKIERIQEGNEPSNISESPFDSAPLPGDEDLLTSVSGTDDLPF